MLQNKQFIDHQLEIIKMLNKKKLNNKYDKNVLKPMFTSHLLVSNFVLVKYP